MQDAALRQAVLCLEDALRSLKFEHATHVFKPGSVSVRHPVDIDGKKNADCLVVEFQSDLPPFSLHRNTHSAGAYAKLLSAQSVAPGRVLIWADGIDAATRRVNNQTLKLPLNLKVFRVIWFTLQPLLIGLSLVSHLREGAPIGRFAERLGRQSVRPANTPTVWLHGASLGEVKQLRGILNELSHLEGVSILVTSFTKSSADWIQSEFPNVVQQFAVIDTALSVRRFLACWDPKVLIISENEIWPEMILQSAGRGLLLLKTGVRPSRTTRSFAKPVSHLLNLFSKITCTTQDMRTKLEGIGVQGRKIFVCADQRKPADTLPVDAESLQHLTHQTQGRKLWLAASTHEADHTLALDAQARLKSHENALLILAPRHPRNAESIKRQCKRRGLTVAQRSMQDRISTSTHVYLADTLGELGTFFSLSPIVFLGGGIGPEGGHNPYEPAAYGCEIVTGRNIDNFENAFASIAATTKVTFIDTADQLVDAILAQGADARTGRDRPLAEMSVNPIDFEAADIVMAAIRRHCQSGVGRCEAVS